MHSTYNPKSVIRFEKKNWNTNPKQRHCFLIAALVGFVFQLAVILNSPYPNKWDMPTRYSIP